MGAASVEARVARAMLDGFELHYARMRHAGREARRLFEDGEWRRMQAVLAERVDYYDERVRECVAGLRRDFPVEVLDERRWGRVKLEYVALLLEHQQPELAEVFFNSVSCRILDRTYFLNQFIFVRPSVSTEYLDLAEPSYRCFYPGRAGLRATLEQVVRTFRLARPFADLKRDVGHVVRALRLALPRPLRAEPNFQLQVLESLFFRGAVAYVVGRAINGVERWPFVVPIVHDDSGRLALDALILDPAQLSTLFSSTRAYFLVDADVPATYVRFLQDLLPTKPTWELYAMLGLGKMAKALFYRDFLHHLRHSTDAFTLAPGTRGLVMSVFTLPSFPYVFKVIRDRAQPPKDVDRDTVLAKYHLVKRADRAGRMADTLEYSNVAFPRARCSPELLAEWKAAAPSQVEFTDGEVVVKHLYIERRLRPLDLYLQQASDAEVDAAVDEFGRCLKELAAADIFAGDLLHKNFGVTRLGRVVFYDYDELEPVTRLRFRDLPTPRTDEDETRGEAWFSVGPWDVFPEEWTHFLYTSPRVEAALRKHHPDLFQASYWRGVQRALAEGRLLHARPYPDACRFRAAPPPATPGGPSPITAL
jgi:isocitrate dehydrogenase kinase/phosphatase